jgi:hypothetical protein
VIHPLFTFGLLALVLIGFSSPFSIALKFTAVISGVYEYIIDHSIKAEQRYVKGRKLRVSGVVRVDDDEWVVRLTLICLGCRSESRGTEI